jgi:polyisoprenoid-binding protein YceI
LAKKIAIVVGIVVVLAAIAGGAVAYSFLRPPATPSGAIQAIPLAPDTATATSGNPVPAAQATNTPAASARASSGQVASASASGAASAAPSVAAAASAAPSAAASQAPASQAAAAPKLFEIDQKSSEARFIINEVLNGEPTTVVGATNQVAGQISVNPTAPTGARVGVLQINARTLATDSDRRDAAIQNQILKTGQHEYITFTPTAITGLPASATLGQSYSFKIVGQLAIAGTTREATFDVTVTPTADGKLQGKAKTTIKYADWNLSIPSVPFVASVEETVVLELDFVALPK